MQQRFQKTNQHHIHEHLTFNCLHSLMYEPGRSICLVNIERTNVQHMLRMLTGIAITT